MATKNTSVKHTRAAAKPAHARAGAKRAATASHADSRPQSQTAPTSAPQKSRRISPVAAYIRHLYDRSAPMLIVEALLFGAIAVYMFFRPMTILTFMTYVIGAALILFGLWRAIAGFVETRNIGGGLLDVLFGLINIVLGILFCIYPTESIISLAYIFVILFFFKALRALVFAINMVRARFGHYIFNLILALVLLGLACALFFFPTATVVAIVYYLAAALLLYAMSDLYMFIELHRLKRAVER